MLRDEEYLEIPEVKYTIHRLDTSMSELGIPEHCKDGLRLYLTHGIEPGGFLLGVLCNDLKGAATRADQTNARYLAEYAKLMMWGMPAGAQGSAENVERWISDGGIIGVAKKSRQLPGTV